MDLNIFGSIGDVADRIIGKFKMDPGKKAELETALKKEELAIQSKVEDHITAEISSRKDIIVAEMNQGDKYTKRARPTMIYAGLFFILFNYVLPTVMVYFGRPAPDPIQLPDMFWQAWGVVVSVWSVGRTTERLGVNNPIIRKITRSKDPS